MAEKSAANSLTIVVSESFEPVVEGKKLTKAVPHNARKLPHIFITLVAITSEEALDPSKRHILTVCVAHRDRVTTIGKTQLNHTHPLILLATTEIFVQNFPLFPSCTFLLHPVLDPVFLDGGIRNALLHPLVSGLFPAPRSFRLVFAAVAVGYHEYFEDLFLSGIRVCRAILRVIRRRGIGVLLLDVLLLDVLLLDVLLLQNNQC